MAIEASPFGRCVHALYPQESQYRFTRIVFDLSQQFVFNSGSCGTHSVRRTQGKNVGMFHAVRKFMQRFVAITLIASLYFIGLHSAHIHLSETHTAGDPHQHGAEVHVAHQDMNHDDFAGGEAHLTDASFVDLEQDGRLSNGPDNLVSIFIALMFLLITPLVVRARGWPLRERVFRIDTPLSARLGARAPP